MSSAASSKEPTEATKADSSPDKCSSSPGSYRTKALSAFRTGDGHYVIVTYWRSFEEHERSHADKIFTSKFAALAAMCSDTKELGYDMLWQGAAESQ